MNRKDAKTDNDIYCGESKATHPGKLGDHPVGGAVGATLGLATGAAIVGAAQGAAMGTPAGLPGMVAGIAIGGVAGALAGKGAAQLINPTSEDEYWRSNYQSCPYVAQTDSYDVYGPAYRHGVDAFNRYEGRSYEEVESDIARDWETAEGTLPWARAKHAARDAYERLAARRDRSKE